TITATSIPTQPSVVNWSFFIEGQAYADAPAEPTFYNEAGEACEELTYHIHANRLATDWPEDNNNNICYSTGGHVDSFFACGPASQHADTTCNALDYTLRYDATQTSNPMTRCGQCESDAVIGGGGCGQGSYNQPNNPQAGCEVGDLSGKMGKRPNTPLLHPFVNQDTNIQTLDTYAQASLVVHCCFEGSCKERVACANLELGKGDYHPFVGSGLL
ncbi:hypothetical protein TeGR_g10761, partial [Tetraparma gracilis]